VVWDTEKPNLSPCSAISLPISVPLPTPEGPHTTMAGLDSAMGAAAAGAGASAAAACAAGAGAERFSSVRPSTATDEAYGDRSASRREGLLLRERPLTRVYFILA